MSSFHRVFLLFAAVCFVLSAVSFAASLDGGGQGGGEPDSCYILRSDGEEICVYADTACTERIGVLDVRASDLPPGDRQLLESGLLIENEEQLLSLIEDYTG